eukprot:c8486_g1_i1.p1 GENE.c8486_g1_i1~~c8486_g1_i1.p1  ORF type:complete len:349 (-),score=79.35 c8486_g1_i1:53-1099(-)
MALLVAGILELDSNGDVLLTASHPKVEPDELEVLKSHSGLLSPKETPLVPLVCSRYSNRWHYIVTVDADRDTRTSLPFVDRFSVFVVTKDFCPEKYFELCQILSKAHNKTGDSVNLMRVFVDVTIKQKYENKTLGLKFEESAFDARRSLLASPLKGLVDLFADDFSVLWLAMALKRRIFVLSSNAAEALRVVRAMPLLVWHRSSWGILRPYVTATDAEIKDLQQIGIFCAGVVGDDSPVPRRVPHDVFVNVPERRVTVTETGNDLRVFAELKIVQDITAAVRHTAAGETDQVVIKTLATKTKELLDKINTIKRSLDSFSIESLKSLDPPLPPHWPQFAFSLAVAEGIA